VPNAATTRDLLAFANSSAPEELPPTMSAVSVAFIGSEQ